MKKVTWDAPVLRNMNSPLAQRPGQFASFQDMWKGVQAREEEQREAESYLKKALPALQALFDYKLTHNEPLVVMRPLQYQTSELVKSDDGQSARFQDTQRMITPGTQLVLKAIDTVMNEFIFHDAMGKEHPINFADRSKLLTQTNIFEEVKKFLEVQGV